MLSRPIVILSSSSFALSSTKSMEASIVQSMEDRYIATELAYNFNWFVVAFGF